MAGNIMVIEKKQNTALSPLLPSKLEFLIEPSIGYRIAYGPWFSTKARVNYIHVERSQVNVAVNVTVLEKMALL